MKRLAALFLFLSLPVVAQAPSIICPVHNVPAQITGHQQKDGEGRVIVWEYCHGTPPDQHCFWSNGKY